MDVTPSCSAPDREVLLQQISLEVSVCLDECEMAGMDLYKVDEALGKARRGIMKVVVQAGVDSAMSKVSALCCPGCGTPLVRHDTQVKEITLREGAAKLVRLRYRCPQCQKDWVPVDEANDLEHTGLTLAAREEIVREAVGEPYRQASEDVKPEIVASRETVSRTVEQAAQWRKAEEQAAVAATLGDMDKPGPMPSGEAAPLSSSWQEKELPEGAVCVASIDGGEFRTTEKDAKGEVAWKEGRVATLSISSEGEQLSPQQAGGKLYLGRHLSAEAMMPILGAAYLLLGVTVRALPLVFVADGGPWWPWVSMYLPGAVEILDIYHAGKYFAAAAAACFGAGSEEALGWAAHAREWLIEPGKLDGLLAQFEAALPQITDEGQRQTVNAAIVHGRTHAPRMRYWEFVAKGYPIGSGGIESAVDRVIQERLRGAGMRWNVKRADDMMCLRAAALSGELPWIYARRREACLKRVGAYVEPLHRAA